MTAPARHIVLMDGPDATGLIARATGILYRRQLNILRNDEYVSPAGQFFMRTEFDVRGTYESPDGPALLIELQTALADCPAIWCQLKPGQQKSMVVPKRLMLSQALKLVFNDRVFIYGNRTVIL